MAPITRGMPNELCDDFLGSVPYVDAFDPLFFPSMAQTFRNRAKNGSLNSYLFTIIVAMIQLHCMLTQ